jgi:hypothetical protein
MGYTHYWRQPEAVDADKFAAFTKKVAMIIRVADDAGIPLGDVMGQGSPELTEKMIAFNGFGKFGYESFVIENGEEFSFCKTAQRPYDAVVTATLIALKRELGDAFIVNSDGTWADWLEGRNLYAETFGVEPEESWVFTNV